MTADPPSGTLFLASVLCSGRATASGASSGPQPQLFWLLLFENPTSGLAGPGLEAAPAGDTGRVKEEEVCAMPAHGGPPVTSCPLLAVNLGMQFSF